MDTVIGNNESNKVLLTLFFRNCKFMMAYLLDKKTASNVIVIFDMLEEKLSKFTFIAFLSKVHFVTMVPSQSLTIHFIIYSPCMYHLYKSI